MTEEWQREVASRLGNLEGKTDGIKETLTTLSLHWADSVFRFDAARDKMQKVQDEISALKVSFESFKDSFQTTTRRSIVIPTATAGGLGAMLMAIIEIVLKHFGWW